MAFNYVAIGKRVHALRLRRGLTQFELAELSKISPSYLSCIETGAKSMSLSTFVAVVNALGASSDDLLLDNLENITKFSAKELATILEDCTLYERRVLMDTLAAVKHSLRNNRSYIQRKP